MFIEELNLINFRNYDNVNIKLSKNINIFYGRNGQGKTNILESIYMLSLAKSYRTKDDNDLLKYNKKVYKIEGVVNKESRKNTYLIKYCKEKKNYYIDSNEYKKISDYISNINVIVFTPDDIQILKGIPDIRRKYLDNQLGQLYNAYYKVSIEYKKILKMRNDILKEYNLKGKIDNNYFNILTNYLIDRAIFIYRAREKYIRKLNQEISNIYEKIIKLSDFHLIYKNQLNINDYSNENIRIKLIELFKNNFNKEKISGTTIYGPHRDDIEFYIGNSNLKNFGSQGQQKLSILSIKLAEMSLFYKQNSCYPILLLDDVFSEFDSEKINNLLKFLNDDMQVIITSTNISQINNKIKDKAKIYNIKDGKLIEK